MNFRAYLTVTATVVREVEADDIDAAETKALELSPGSLLTTRHEYPDLSDWSVSDIEQVEK